LGKNNAGHRFFTIFPLTVIFMSILKIYGFCLFVPGAGRHFCLPFQPVCGMGLGTA
jgi:hypothetical protein